VAIGPGSKLTIAASLTKSIKLQTIEATEREQQLDTALVGAVCLKFLLKLGPLSLGVLVFLDEGLKLVAELGGVVSFPCQEGRERGGRRRQA
jgi:hypothetical protein